MSELILPEHLVKNKAVQSREELPLERERTQKSRYWLERAGQTLQADADGEYVGSAAVHYYRLKGEGPNNFRFAAICQIKGMTEVEEGFADYGHKELQKALMEAYGRDVKDKK